MDIYNVDDAAPKKLCQHILAVVDTFTRFSMLYPVRSIDAVDIVDQLEKQSVAFRNLRGIIFNEDSMLISIGFEHHCCGKNEGSSTVQS